MFRDEYLTLPRAYKAEYAEVDSFRLFKFRVTCSFEEQDANKHFGFLRVNLTGVGQVMSESADRG